MNAMKTRTILIIALVALLALGGLYTMCSTESALEDCPECLVLERTDIEISGDVTADHFQASSQNDDAVDLITYNFLGDQTPQIDFLVRLANGEQLVITVVDKETLNPWEQVGKPYNIYPNGDLDDKLSYTTIEYLNKENGVAYATNDASASVSRNKPRRL